MKKKKRKKIENEGCIYTRLLIIKDKIPVSDGPILDLVTIDNRSTVLEQDTMSSANGFNSLVQLSIRFIPTPM